MKRDLKRLLLMITSLLKKMFDRKETLWILLLSIMLLIPTSNLLAMFEGYGAIYPGYIFYNNSSLRSSSYFISPYFQFNWNASHYLQLGSTYTRFNFQDNSYTDQLDVTMTYSNVDSIMEDWTFFIGGHYVYGTNEVIIIMGDITKSFFSRAYLAKVFKLSSGISTFYSSYSDGTSVIQLTPHMTLKLFSFSTIGTLYISLLGNYILTDISPVSVSGNKGKYSNNDVKGFLSYGGDITYYLGKFYLSVGGWNGNKIYAVEDGGFAVLNDGYQYTEGFSGKLGFVGNRWSTGLNVSTRKYIESTGREVTQIVTSLYFGYKFLLLP